MMNFKDIIRELLIFFHIDLTKNIKYDRLTRTIIKNSLRNNSNCIDIGCHKGQILDLMIKYAPAGKHYAFEPIPYLFDELQKKYKDKAMVYPFALSDTSGKTSFQLVKNAPAYSGIKKRHYDIANPNIEEIFVELRTLDEIIPKNEIIHFIKIDVEGAEFCVLKGGKNLLKKNKPIILFEFGKGASDYYGTKPSDLFIFLTQEIGLQIFTLYGYTKAKQHLSQLEFEDLYNSEKEYYFIAVPSIEK